MKNFQKYLIDSSATVRDALVRLNELSSDILVLFVVNENNKLIGTLTDGDIRRGLIAGKKLEDSVVLFCREKFFFLNHSNLNLNTLKVIKEEQIKLVPFISEDGCIERLFNFTKRKTILPIDAVLMAGGRGERLRPLTDRIPKPMIKIGNKPIIEHNIDNLKEHGVDNFYLSVNYLSEQIEEYFGNGESKEIELSYIRESKPLGTIGSISMVDNFKSDTILVMNSDLFTNINYEDFYINFIRSGAEMSVASIPYNISIPFAILELEEDNIKSFEEKPSYTYYANAGIYLIKKEVLSYIPQNELFNATDLIQTLIVAGKRIIKYPIVGYWVDIGRHEDLIKVQDIYKHVH